MLRGLLVSNGKAASVEHQFIASTRAIRSMLEKIRSKKTEFWAQNHLSAWQSTTNATEQSIRNMIEGWGAHADQHFDKFGSLLVNDYVLGPAWADIGQGILRLLNGSTGRFDCGTLDGLIRQIGRDAGGFDTGGW